MKRPVLNALAAGASTLLVAAMASTAATAQPVQASPSPAQAPSTSDQDHRSDNRPGPLTAETEQQRQAALDKIAQQPRALDQQSEGATVELDDGKYVEFPRERDDRILTILAEFGTESSGRYGRTPGPLHNEIPQPDRSVDNSTIWTEDFNPAHYENLFNGGAGSMRHYYEQVSSGRYSVTSGVEGWTKVPYNGSYYGDNAIEDDGGSWQFIADSVDSWYADQVAAGKTPDEIKAMLAEYDVWDRYDYDADGDFNESDGYIDHFQAVHAGEGEEAGADEDMIWSHRWYAFGTDFGSTGPSVNGSPNLMGGTEIGDTGIFVGDYTVEPENGGVGVFAHEYAHDLGLPDFYDTAGGDNGVAFWSLMSSGSWLSHGNNPAEGIGTDAGLMGPQEKLELGWLDYSEVNPGESLNTVLNPAVGTTETGDQAVKVNLPDASVTNDYTTPIEGSNAWWTGSADGLNVTLTHEVPATGRVTVSADAWYDIEADYDYLYAEYSLDGGATWTKIGQAVDGTSRGWESLRYAYRAGGQESLFRFRYQTDGGVHLAGAFLDNLTIKAGQDVVVTDGAESDASTWTADGWKRSTGSETTTAPQFYLAENREYLGYDNLLKSGPYNFSEAYTRPNWVEFFPYQNGMLVWYVNYSQEDNNTSVHPGSGRALPVDARPEPFRYSDGTMPGNRRQPFDATFGLEATDEVCLHKQVLTGTKNNEQVETLEACAPSNAGIPTFTDVDPNAYWSADNPMSSVKVAGHGVSITVTGDEGDDLSISVTNPAE